MSPDPEDCACCWARDELLVGFWDEDEEDDEDEDEDLLCCFDCSMS